MRGTRAVAGVLVLVAAAVLTACQGGLSDEGEPLTLAQAELLAQARFGVAAHGDGVVDVSIGAEDDVDRVSAHLTVDHDDGLAWGELERGPVALATTERVAFTPDAYLVEGSQGWVTTGAPSPLLALVFVLGSDRPENAQLLLQSDARFLGSADDEGVPLDVFRPPGDEAGTAHTRMWLDEAGALRRFDVGDDVTLVIRVRDAEPEPRGAELDRLLGSEHE